MDYSVKNLENDSVWLLRRSKQEAILVEICDSVKIFCQILFAQPGAGGTIACGGARRLQGPMRPSCSRELGHWRPFYRPDQAAQRSRWTVPASPSAVLEFAARSRIIFAMRWRAAGATSGLRFLVKERVNATDRHVGLALCAPRRDRAAAARGSVRASAAVDLSSHGRIQSDQSVAESADPCRRRWRRVGRIDAHHRICGGPRAARAALNAGRAGRQAQILSAERPRFDRQRKGGAGPL